MIRLTWNRELQFTAHDDFGHEITVDTELGSGGLDQGFRPLDLLLVALAGCMAMDIVAILRKKGGKIAKFEIVLSGEKSAQHPKKFSRIKYEIKCDGNYRREDLLRSFELSRDKYCSVLATLKNPPEFEFKIY
jgi:putative redox protein